MERTTWFNPMIEEYDGTIQSTDIMVPCEPELNGVPAIAPNLVSSMMYTANGFVDRHSPVLDIDFPARLLPSSTEGHFHLYLDGLTLPWAEYAKLLRALAIAGVIEMGYYEASVRRQMTCVRLPGISRPSRR